MFWLSPLKPDVSYGNRSPESVAVVLRGTPSPWWGSRASHPSGRVGDGNEFALGVGLKDLLEQELADGECGGNIAEVQGPGVEGAAGVVIVDEIHLVSRDLFGRGREVMEVEIGGAARQVGVDLRHVHPGYEGIGKGIHDALCWLVDLRYAEDIIDVGDNGKTGGRDKIGGCVSGVGAICVHAQARYLCSAVSWQEIAARSRDICDGDEFVKIAFDGRLPDQCYVLRSSSC